MSDTTTTKARPASNRRIYFPTDPSGVGYRYGVSVDPLEHEGFDEYLFVTIVGQRCDLRSDGSWGIPLSSGWREVAAVGDRVIPKPVNDGDTNVDWYGVPEYYRDKVGVITSVSEGSAGPTYSAEFQSQQKPDDTVNWSFCDCTIVLRNGEGPAVPVEPAIITDLQQTVERLEAEAARWKRLAEQREQSLATGKETHEDLGKRLLGQAVNRGWCSEFDEFVTDYNAECPAGWEIPERRNRVEKRMRLRGEVYRDVTVWVDEGDDTSDADNWYDSEDSDSPLGDEWAQEQIDDEKDNNGYDEMTYSVLR